MTRTPPNVVAAPGVGAMPVRSATAGCPAVDQTATSSKLVALVEQVEAGRATKELERQVDELRPRFQQAMQKGRENMGRMQSHIERVAKSVETIEGATILGARDLDA